MKISSLITFTFATMNSSLVKGGKPKSLNKEVGLNKPTIHEIFPMPDFNLENYIDVKDVNQKHAGRSDSTERKYGIAESQDSIDLKLPINNQDKDGYTALIDAIFKGQKEAALKILENNDLAVNIQDNKNGNTALIGAIVSGQKEVALKILENNGLDVNLQDKDGMTALMWAIDKGQQGIALKILEKSNINVNLQGENGVPALIGAIVTGQKEAALKILEKEDVNVNLKDTNGYTVLMLAIASDQKEVAFKILKNKDVNVNIQDTDGYTALMCAIEQDQQGIALKILEKSNINVNLQEEKGVTALIWAIISEQKEVALKILENEDVNVNLQDKDASTALMWAIIKNLPEVTKKILKNKDVNLNLQDKKGYTALIRAIRLNSEQVASEILKRPDVNLAIKNNEGMSALFMSIHRNSNKITLKILDKDNVNINKKDKNGNTALHHVTGMGNYEIIRKLLKKDGIDLFIENKQGLSPFMLSLLESEDNVLIPLSFFKIMTEQNIINLTDRHPIRDNYKIKEQLEKINNLPEELYYELNFDLKGRITMWDRNFLNFLEDKPFEYNYIDIAYSDKLISIHIYFLLIPLFLTGYIFLLPQKYCKSLLYSALILYYKENKAKETYKLALDLLYINEITRKIITANNYGKEAIESNKIPDLIKQLTETQVDSTLPNINGSQNKYIKTLLLDRQAVIKQPNLIYRLKELEKLSLPSIYNLSEINKKPLMNFLNINPNEIKRTANELIAEFEGLKINSSSLKNTEIDHKSYTSILNDVNAMEDIINKLGNNKNDVENKICGLKQNFEKQIDNEITKLKNAFSRLKSNTISLKTLKTLNDYLITEKIASNQWHCIQQKHFKEKTLDEIKSKYLKKINDFLELFKEIPLNNQDDESYTEFELLLSNADLIKTLYDESTLTKWLQDRENWKQILNRLEKKQRLEELTLNILKDDTCLKTWQYLFFNKQNTEAIIFEEEDEDNNDSSQNSEIFNQNTFFEIKKRPIEILIQHLGELGIEFQKENNYQSVVSFKSATAIASTICLSTDERLKDVNNTVNYFVKYCVNKNNKQMDAETNMLIEELKRTLGVLAIPFVKQLIPQYSQMKETKKQKKEKALLDDINNKRKELELQSNLTIINNMAHTNNQNHVKEKTNQLTDYRKILHEFKEGLTRLNLEFKTLKLSEIHFTEEDISIFVNIYKKYMSKETNGGSHYRLVGPLIIPSKYQHLSNALIYDRWIALSAFKELKTFN